MPCSWRTRGLSSWGSARNDVQRERAGRPGRGADARGGEELDPVAVGIGYLDTHETAIVLPFGLRNACPLEPLASPPDLVGVIELEAEVECVERGLGDGAFLEREERAVRRCKDEQVLVVVEPLGEPEVPAVEVG